MLLHLPSSSSSDVLKPASNQLMFNNQNISGQSITYISSRDRMDVELLDGANFTPNVKAGRTIHILEFC